MNEKRCPGCMNLKPYIPVCPHCGHDERTPNMPHQLQPGTVLQGQYMVGKVLGQGGFGITYIGWDLVLEIPIAIKEYYPQSLVTRSCTISPAVLLYNEQCRDLFVRYRDKFAREARSLAKLGADEKLHNIVRVHNLVQAHNTAYIIMEYVGGINLRKYIERKKAAFTVKETLGLLLPVMESLERIHSQNIIHRDISPDNIMVLPDGSTKLIDFGAAHEMRVNAAGKQASTDAILKHGFAPPEQYQQSGGLGPWTDVYAMCATIYHCITTQVPPSAPDRMLGDRDFEWSAIPGLSSSMIQALKKGTALRKADRFQNMTELQHALTAGAEGTSWSDGIIDWFKKNRTSIVAAAAVILGCLLAPSLLPSPEPAAPTIPPEPTIVITPTETIAAPKVVLPEPMASIPEQPTEAPEETYPEPILTGTPVTELTLMKNGNDSFGGSVISGRWKDALGEFHEDSLLFWVCKKDGYDRLESVRYHLDKSHTEIFGTICAAEESEDGAAMTVEIWVNGVLAYTSEPILRDSQIPFHVDFSNLQERCDWSSLIIQCMTESRAYGYCIVDARVN